ncbi:MAG TPA: hypothetical protein VE981_16385 [Planctomycetota bacterium]|nr:hypothetical protein [Planctomycetota bacterium]
MYRRFVVLKGYVYGRHRPGLLRDMADRESWKHSSGKRRAEFDAICEGLNEHLPRPPRDVFARRKAICWFKPGAGPYFEKMRALADIYEELDVLTREIVHPDPGRVTYEDEHQIVAVPPISMRFRSSTAPEPRR